MTKPNNRHGRAAFGIGYGVPVASGPVRSIQPVLDLVDTAEPAWPMIAAVLQEFKAAGIELDEHSVAMAVKLGRHRPFLVPPPDATGPVQGSLASSAASIVYYVRRGDLIKIGTTTDPRSRFQDLFPEAILAVEPGDQKLESARHWQFRHLRASGEHFRDEPELRLHAFQVRSTYGDPDPSWRTAAQGKWRESDPAAVETMTAAEAEAELGIKNGTLRGWVHRGLIRRAGATERRRAYYRKDHLIALRDSPATRMSQGL